ncbi:MAG: Glycerol-3-phosphate ABC transporter, substrate-binding protein UgpB [Candidatus Burkholderia crenata]|nr:MAG: Glycerol-3-phosphate ABC transporter, substrate-binding protein UgpB [Candidatus Burkholderia crenata]
MNDIANDFNASQSNYKIVPVYKGSYDQTMAAGIAVYRSGNAPAILQVYHDPGQESRHRSDPSAENLGRARSRCEKAESDQYVRLFVGLAKLDSA